MTKNNLSVLGIIPARGGSVGVPRKNLLKLQNKPLIAYTIEAAKASALLTRTICSTDDAEIRDVALGLGAEVPFLRPAELAKNDTPILPVVQHAVRFLNEQGFSPDIIVLLQPTSPFRSAKHIDEAIELLINSRCDSVVSLCRAKENPYWMRVIDNGRVQSFIEQDNGTRYYQRQKLPDVYRLNGAIYASWTSLIMERNQLIGQDVAPLIMEMDESIDIDTPWDLDEAREVLKKKVHVNQNTFIPSP